MIYSVQCIDYLCEACCPFFSLTVHHSQSHYTPYKLEESNLLKEGGFRIHARSECHKKTMFALKDYETAVKN